MSRFIWTPVSEALSKEEIARILNRRMGELTNDLDTRDGRSESVRADAPVGIRQTQRYVMGEQTNLARVGFATVVEVDQASTATQTARRTHIDATLASGTVSELVGHHVTVRRNGAGAVTDACGLKIDVTGATTNKAICIVAGKFVTADSVCVETSVDLGDEMCVKVAGDPAQPSLHFYRALGDLTTPLAVTAGKALMNINISGHDGAVYAQQARIEAVAHAAWGGADRSTRMSFYTTAQGSTVITERLRIHHDGLIEAFGSVVIASAAKVYAVSTDNFLQPDDGSGNLRLASRGNLIIDIDSDNNQADRLLQVTKDGATIALLNVRESGQVEVVTGPLQIGTAAATTSRLDLAGAGQEFIEVSTAGFLDLSSRGQVRFIGDSNDNDGATAELFGWYSVSTGTKMLSLAKGPTLALEGNNPIFKFIEGDQAVDNRRWRIISASSILRFQALNDAETVATQFLNVIRTGTTINTLEFPNGVITIGTDPGGTQKVRIGGGVNIANASQLSWRNAGGTGDIKVLAVTAGNVTELNATTGLTISLQVGQVEQARVATTGIVLVTTRDIRSSSSAEQYLQPDDGSGNLRINSRGNVFVVIDSDNNSTANVFDVYHHGTATVRLRVNETGQVLMPDGAVGTPSHSFLNNTNMGMYRKGANNLALAVSGSVAVEVTSTRSIHGIAQPRCRAFHSSVQSIGSGAFTTLSFDGEDFDTGSLHDTAVNNSRITVPATGAGIWVVSAIVDWGGSAMAAGTVVRVRLLKNGVAITGAEIAVVIGSSESDRRMSMTWLDEAAASDYFEVQVFQNTGGSRNVDVASRFMAAKLW